MAEQNAHSHRGGEGITGADHPHPGRSLNSHRIADHYRGRLFHQPGPRRFRPQNPAIVADAAHPESPKTIFGLIIAGLKARREAGIQPFTVMSCDNIPHNGIVARNAVAGLSRLSDPELSDWIIARVAFPNAMVDRITPATGDRERQILARDFAIDDAWPVFCEDFNQWVLEDSFPEGRPALETVGVQFVPDVTPYEHMKIRILNGGHAVIAYPAGLMDIHFDHEAMEHPHTLGFLRKVEGKEIIPIVPPVPNTDLHEYYRQTESRFANPKIGDTIRRLCLDGSNRQPKFIIPSIADRLKAGLDITGLALESALWCRYCYGTTESGREIEANDPNWDRLMPVARAAKDDPTAWLGMTDIYGEVGKSAIFRKRFTVMLQDLWTERVERVVRQYVQGSI
jgi:mannitol 2-dehydrogenase